MNIFDAISSAIAGNETAQSVSSSFDGIAGAIKSGIGKVKEFFTGQSSEPSLSFPVSESGKQALLKGVLPAEEQTKYGPPEQALNFIVDSIRAIPRAGASLGLQTLGLKQAEVQPTTGLQRTVFGDEPVKASQRLGESTISEFGGAPSTASKYGLSVGLGLGIFDVVPGLPGKKEGVELSGKLVAKYGKNIAEQIVKQGGKELAEKAVAEGGESIVKNVGIDIAQMGAERFPRDFINLDRMNIAPEAKRTIQNTIDEIRPVLEKAKGGVLSNQEAIDAAVNSEILRRATSKEATLASEAALLRTRQHLAALAEGDGVTKEFIETLRIVSQEATRRGRELQALSIGADASLATAKTQLVKQLIDIGIGVDNILKAAQGIDFTNMKDVTSFYRAFVKPKLPEIIDEYRYINLLSSPKTHIVNAFSNLLQAAVVRPSVLIASSGIDKIAVSFGKKEREHYISQVPAFYRGAFSGIGDASAKALNALKGKSYVARPDIKTIPTGSKMLAPFQAIPRLLEASDVFFRTIIESAEKASQMQKYAKQGKAANMAKIAEEAARIAEEFVFRKALDPSNKSGHGKLLSQIDKLTNAIYQLREVPGIKWFIPFVQTPMNILKQGIEFSPLGISTLPGNERKIEQLGKVMTGSFVMASAGAMAIDNRTTWAAPSGTKEKQAFYDAGLQPYSVKIGDTWVGYSKLGPLAYPLAMAAAIKFYISENPKAATDTALQKTTKILSGIAEFFSSQSYVEGIGDLVSFSQAQPGSGSRILSNVPSQLIPLASLQRWVANIIDPIYRKAEKPTSIDGVIDNLKKGIPGFSKDLAAYTTPEGKPSERQSPLLNAISPLSITAERPDQKAYYDTLIEFAKERAVKTFNEDQLKSRAEDIYQKMLALPKNEAADQFDVISQNDPELAKEISSLVVGEGITPKDKAIKSLGIRTGERARFLVKEIGRLGTQDEKRAYYDDMIKKGIITNEVSTQLNQLLQAAGK